MTWQGAIIMTLFFVVCIIGLLIMAENKYGMKIFEFIMSFFMSPEKFKSIDWHKPVPTWLSVITWVVYLGILIYSGIKYF